MDVSLLSWLVLTTLAIVLLYMLSSFSALWERRRVVAEAAMALLLVGLPFLLAAPLTWIDKLILSVVQAWLLVLGARLIFGRLNGSFLQTSTKHNALIALALLLLMVVSLLGLVPVGAPTVHELLLSIATGLSLLVAALLVYQAVWTLKHYRLRKIDKRLTDKDLPTVTLAVPARNERHALTECLTDAVVSDYPKLEILVADDQSQDNTPQIIRAFAQEGVRFVPSGPLSEGWLGKNQAMKTLAEHASGEYILFVGVDTRLSPQSIRKLVLYALSNRVEMVSVLPQRRDGPNGATLWWTLRYYWQAVLPITRRRVPVASQCWLIRSDALYHLGGFDAVKHKIVPEGSFARRLFTVNMYRFLISNAELGVTTAKRWTSQAETALRFLYPTFKRQPLYALIGCTVLLGLILGPFVVMGIHVAQADFNFIWLVATIASLLYLVSYGLVITRAIPRSWPLTLVAMPFSLAQDSLLLVVSMLLYEFGEVNWKGRDVSRPVVMAARSNAANRASAASKS